MILRQTGRTNQPKPTFTAENLTNAATASQTEPTPDNAYITLAVPR